MPPEDGSVPAEDGSAPRRFLIATAITRYPKATHLGWDRPDLADARRRVVELFTNRLGYRHVTDLGLDPTSDQLTTGLRAFCMSAERRPDDLVAVYIAGHGEVLDDDGEHVLLTADTDPKDIDDALPTRRLARKILRRTHVRRLLMLLDTCYSGRGGNELAAAALDRMNHQWGEETGSGLIVISAAQPQEQAETGAFPHLLEQAVTSLATAGHGPRTLALDSVVQRMNDHPDRPPHQRIGLTQIGLTGEVPPFLANPRHQTRRTEVDLELQQAAQWEEHAARRETEFRTRLLAGAQGATPDHAGWWFAGRRAALGTITDWLVARSPAQPALAVTGDPGSGKTAVLGLIAALTHPERRRTVPFDSLVLDPQSLPQHAVDVSIHAQNLTNDQVLQGLAAGARVRAGTLGEFLEALGPRKSSDDRPFTVLIDALDEAATPILLCSQVLRPLITHASGRVRLLMGTRPHLLPWLELERTGRIDVVDLDADRYADPDALLEYTIRTLIRAHPRSPYENCPPPLRMAVARGIAAAAGRSFLVARISAGTLAADPALPDPADPAWRASLPKLPSEAMRRDLRQRLGADAARATDLLRPLAFAEGRGLPWEDIWAPLAEAVSERPCVDDDLLWLREAAGAYVVEVTEDGRSAYRLYHRALAEHLREGVETAAVHAAFTRTLVSRVPYGPDGARDWSRAHPYTRRHLAGHAAHGGLLDELVTDPEYLVHADPAGLMPHLPMARSPAAQLPATIYRTSFGTHRRTGTDERRQILALDAARYNVSPFLAALNGRAADHMWKPLWGSGGTLSPTLRDTLPSAAGPVRAMALALLDGHPVAVTGHGDTTVRVHELATGRSVGQPLTGHTGAVTAVACIELNGRPVAVTGSGDRTVRVWDLNTGTPVGGPLAGHTGPVVAAACTELGRPVAVTGSYDGTVRVWDLATGKAIGQPMTGHTSTVAAVACTELDGRPVAISCSGDRTVRVWDLETSRPVLDPMQTGHGAWVNGVACARLGGRPVLVTASSDGTLRVWDLGTRRLVRGPMFGHTRAVVAITCAVLDGRPVAVSASSDGTVRAWELATGESAGEPMTGHTGGVNAVACLVLDGSPIAVTASDDRTVRVWDLLTAGKRVGAWRTGHTGEVTVAVATRLGDRPVAVTGASDKTVRMWDASTGQALGKPLTGHIATVVAVACTVLDGRSVAVTGSDDGTVRVWDLTSGQALATRMARGGSGITAVACMTLDDRPLVVGAAEDGTARAWDLATGEPFGEPVTVSDGPLRAVACGALNGRPVGVVASACGELRVWDPATGSTSPLGDHDRPGAVRALAVTALARGLVTVTGSDDRTARVWDLDTRTPIGGPLAGHTGPVTAVACASLDGRAVAVTGSGDRTVRVWDLTMRRQTGVVHLMAPCRAVALSEEGHLICCFGDHIAVLASGRLVRE
ncbi:hypothetical protein M271_12520 [Streptomyces rapamycinicus NRRL 5491]|uniref:Uncharacterized protein n=1 Tax=Streptomyces rapamycinicus (strain ATCC 29253 / DSM 41530 / NRRL 5491 / AYB-994) TaxID=1343740 RepID=A0A0A0NI74_STRRN|nr:hypothetical protein M271_12520 [Streptomyces rapamycinicus NRRL 5491]RLV73759.1 hypothetical protein D3C57_131075 [Streptomyces rapamycinicus NRRL 5491]